jgi:hypothetical protein
VPHDPSDRSASGRDRQSEQWWEELGQLEDGGDQAGSARPVPGPVSDRRFERAGRRRARADRRARGGESLGTKGARSLLTFFALLVVAAGVTTLTERGWEQAREASFAEGGHLDGTTVRGGDGVYAFLSTQRGTMEPVTYGACRTIEVQVNASGEVPGGSQLVLDAMSHVSDLTGLELVYSGPTTERPDAWAERMTGGELEAYPPVLISWSDEDETPALAGDVVGLGGSISLRGGSYARTRYMTGSVTLDGPDLSEIHEQGDGQAKVRAVILHELGHLVGLGHVKDTGELMSESNAGQLDFGSGDREGLARLGGDDC